MEKIDDGKSGWPKHELKDAPEWEVRKYAAYCDEMARRCRVADSFREWADHETASTF